MTGPIHKLFLATVTNGVAAVTTVSAGMSDLVKLAIISAAATTIGTIVTVIFAYKAKIAGEHAKVTAEATGKAVNGKMEEFKKLYEELFLAKGVVQGRAEVKSENLAVAEAKIDQLKP